MNFKLRKYLLVIVWIPLALEFSHQSFASGEGHIRFVKEHYNFTFNTDSTSEELIDVTWRAIDQQGVNTLGQQYLRYDTRRQSLELLDAEAIPVQGSPIPVAKGDIKIQDGVLSGISYPEAKVLQISFPKLAPGDSIHYRYRFAVKTLDLPGGASVSYFLARDVIRDDTVITLRYPETLPLKLATNEIESAEDTTIDKIRQLRWTYHSNDTVAQKPGAVNACFPGNDSTS